MILCLDSGNTRLKWGLYEVTGQWRARGAVVQDAVSELALQLKELPAPLRVVGCNVASALQAETISKVLQRPIEWLSTSVAAGGVKNGYLHPAQLGVDRWAALIAARMLHSGSVLVVNAGTATTVDMLTEDGEFCGGIILPGVQLMRAALAKNTAQLPLSNAAYAPFPNDTATAISAGTLEAQVGAIARMFERLPGVSKHCLLGGGAAAEVAPLLKLPLTQVDDLVLRGVAIMATAVV